MVGLLQRLVGLRDEGRGPLDALLAVGDLLGELPKPLSLGRAEETGERQDFFQRSLLMDLDYVGEEV